MAPVSSGMPPAVLLAAGESSRFWPLSTHGHKALHRLAGQAIIEHTVRSLAAAGVRRLVVVQSPIARAAHFPHRTVADQLGDGRRYGVAITYVDQPEAAGPGDAILQAAEQLSGEFLVVQPDNLNAGEIAKELCAAGRSDAAGVMALQARRETWLFGVAAHQDGLVTDLVEKPAPGTEPSNLCNMGVYLLDQRYLEILRTIPSHQHSSIYALTKLAQSEGLVLKNTTHPFFPLKYPWHLYAMRDFLVPEGNWIGAQAQIGEETTLERCVIERDTVVAPRVQLIDCLIGAGSEVHSDLTGCIVGAGVTIGVDVHISSNSSAKETSVYALVKDAPVDTGRGCFGAVIGHGTTLEAGARLAAGTLVGAEVQVRADPPVPRVVGDRSGLTGD